MEHHDAHHEVVTEVTEVEDARCALRETEALSHDAETARILGVDAYKDYLHHQLAVYRTQIAACIVSVFVVLIVVCVTVNMVGVISGWYSWQAETWLTSLLSSVVGAAFSQLVMTAATMKKTEIGKTEAENHEVVIVLKKRK